MVPENAVAAEFMQHHAPVGGDADAAGLPRSASENTTEPMPLLNVLPRHCALMTLPSA